MAINLPDSAWPSTFNVQRLAFGGGQRSVAQSEHSYTFELTPAALLLGFAQPKLYERLSAARQTPNAKRQTPNAKRQTLNDER
jgi:hypothetical protein